MRWAGHVALKGERRSVYGFWLGGGGTEGKRPFGRPKHRWEENMRIDLQEAGCRGIDWIDLAQDRNRCWALVNAVMNF